MNKMDYKERARRRLVKFIFIIYWLLIFEGALRKWGLPAFQEELFFIRVPFALMLYWLALRRGFWPKTNGLLLLIYLIAFVSIWLVPVQMLAGDYGLRYAVIAGYGWMNYFFYVPLAFIIPRVLQREDLYRIFRHTLWFGLVNVPMVFLQFSSSPDSIFNRGSAHAPAAQFTNLGAALGYIRPAGTFTSSLGLALFLGALTISVVYGWLLVRKHTVAGWRLLTAATLALLMLLGLSGNRTAFVVVALVILSTTLSGILTRRRRLVTWTVLVPTMLVALLVVLWPIVLPQGYKVFTTRWNTAETSESHRFEFGFIGRAIYPFYGWTDYLNSPVGGYLLGLGGNAAGRLKWVRSPPAAHEWTGYGTWGRESGWAIHLIELGIPLGMLYIFFRVWFSFWVLKHVLRAAYKHHDVLPLMIFGFVGSFLFFGQLTTQGSVNGFAWFFIGLALVASEADKCSMTKQAVDWRPVLPPYI